MGRAESLDTAVLHTLARATALEAVRKYIATPHLLLQQHPDAGDDHKGAWGWEVSEIRSPHPPNSERASKFALSQPRLSQCVPPGVLPVGPGKNNFGGRGIRQL